MTHDDLSALLQPPATIAVVGLSADPGKTAHAVPAFLQSAGYRIVPVNPHHDEILGERSYPTLGDVPGPVDVVEVFRPSAEAPEVARQAVEIGAKVLWLQLGITSPQAREIAENAGLSYVENRCMGVERARRDTRARERQSGG